MIPHYGWQSVLVLGGVMPLLLAVVLIFFCRNPRAIWW
jgi:AAHS family 4-hydroxybenzoate transporter-like MFS transporter